MRSLLFVPADSERKLARGLESGADALILDLEDSVAASNRSTARRLAREFLEAHGPDRIRRYVRVNPLASGLALDDLAATVSGRPNGILLPKCVPGDVRTLDVSLEGRAYDEHRELDVVEQRGEDLRLAYVALTRAKRTLVLSHAQRRYGRPTRPSRFIAEALAAPATRAAA